MACVCGLFIINESVEHLTNESQVDQTTVSVPFPFFQSGNYDLVGLLLDCHRLQTVHFLISNFVEVMTVYCVQLCVQSYARRSFRCIPENPTARSWEQFIIFG